MAPEYAALLLHIGFGSVFFGAIFFKLLPEARREKFQQSLFKIRNDLFLWTWENGRDFNTPEYREIRRRLNRSIRYAETVNVPTVLLGSIAFRDHQREDLFKDVEDQEFRKRLQRAQREMETEIAYHLFMSWLGLPCTIVVFFWLSLRSAIHHGQTVVKDAFSPTTVLGGLRSMKHIVVYMLVNSSPVETYITQAEQEPWRLRPTGAHTQHGL